MAVITNPGGRLVDEYNRQARELREAKEEIERLRAEIERWENERRRVHTAHAEASDGDETI